MTLKPYYDEGGITIYHGDCREVLPKLEIGGHIITDPPYEAEAHTLQRRTNQGRTRGGPDDKVTEAPLDFAPIDEETRTLVSKEFARIARGWILVSEDDVALLCSPSRLRDALQLHAAA